MRSLAAAIILITVLIPVARVSLAEPPNLSFKAYLTFDCKTKTISTAGVYQVIDISNASGQHITINQDFSYNVVKGDLVVTEDYVNSLSIGHLDLADYCTGAYANADRTDFLSVNLLPQIQVTYTSTYMGPCMWYGEANYRHPVQRVITLTDTQKNVTIRLIKNDSDGFTSQEACKKGH